jgi:tRNA pseudouridine55 synthase
MNFGDLQIQNPKSKIQNMLDGILIIDKPEGITSHDVVARCRRILRTKRIGHTGTLDPFATGVMVILVGKATRLAQFLDKDAKEYEATVRFGFETTTGDLTGEIKESSISNFKFQISKEEIENALKDFRGEILQTPPMFSAKKVEGKKLYELARKGIEIERKAVKVKIYELEIIENQESKTKDQRPKTEDHALRVVCSAGTYIRVLAEDLGKQLGVGAHLAELRRTRAGKFDLSKAVTLEELEKIAAENNLEKILISMNEAVSHLAEIKLSEEDAGKIKNGVKLKRDSDEIKDGELLRLTDRENLLAIGFYKKAEKEIQPKLVLV